MYFPILQTDREEIAEAIRSIYPERLELAEAVAHLDDEYSVSADGEASNR